MKKSPEQTAFEQTMLSSLNEGDAFPPSSATPAPTTSRIERLRARLTPLHERLRVQLNKLPPEYLANGLHLSEVWPLCSGRQREKPRAFEVADALRQLGWQRLRLYSDSTMPSGTWWFPPGVLNAEAKAAMRRRKVAA